MLHVTGKPLAFCLSLFFTAAFFFTSFADGIALPGPEPAYRRFAQQDGLPSSECYFVYQDRKGAIWCCTDRGVSRYDGYRFQTYSLDNGLTDNAVFRVFEDDKGRIWFITMNNMLSYYYREKIVAFPGNAVIKRSMSTTRVAFKSFFQRSDGSYVFALRGLGYFVLQADGRVDTSHFGATDDERVELMQSPGGYHTVSWVGRLSIGVSPVVYGGMRSEGARPIGYISSSYDMRMTGTPAEPYIISDRKIFILKNGALTVFETGYPVIFVEKKGSSLWVGHAQGGVSRYETSPGKDPVLLETFLQGYSVTGMCDAGGGKWFTTLEEGLIFTPSLAVRSWLNEDQLGAVGLRQINGVGNDVYVLTSSGRFIELNAPWKRSEAPPTLALCMLEKFNGKMLLPGYYDPKWGLSRELAERIVRSRAHYNAKGELLIYTVDQRIVSIRPDGSERELFRMPEDRLSLYVNAIIRDEGIIYVGAESGMYMLRGGQLVSMARVSPLHGKNIIGMVRHPRLGIVVATKNYGVYAFGKNRALIRITQENGLSYNSINQLATDERGRLWVASHAGVDIITFRNGSWSARNLSTHEGLPSNEVTGIYINEGNVWLATKRGVSLFNTSVFSGEDNHGDIYLDYTETGQGRFSGEPSKMSFSARERFIRFVFGTTEFRSSGDHNFRYRTDPSEGWIYIRQPEVFLNEPSSGPYRIEISYRAGTGRWSEPVLLAAFSIPEMFYDTAWFFSLMVALFLVAVYLLFRMRVKQLSRRHSLRTTISDLEQRALAAQMNPHFIFNALNSIQSFLVYEENIKAEKYLLKFSSLIRQMLTNSREKYIRIDQELSILSNYLDLERMRFKDKFTYYIDCRLDASEKQFFIPPMLVQPYVENAVLHGMASRKSGGRIIVTFERISVTELKISIDDNGLAKDAIGKPKKSMHRSFGTTITQERLRFLTLNSGSSFNVEMIDKSAVGKGTGVLIELTLPVLDTYETPESNNR
jgi:hypothetical protein